MLKKDNVPLNSRPSDGDFTLEHYRVLLRLARKNYPMPSYSEFSFGERFLLWRHDCDFSLNRSLVLGEIEREEGIRATYFINLHSEFYNPLERTQTQIIEKLGAMGHDIGLHFDGAFYETSSEQQLEEQVHQEADFLERIFAIRPIVFSFHNPSKFHLDCEAERYGGLINCYSKRFKDEVPYCSDSNGYWRFRRLYDVLNEAEDKCLQVLTHPGWWQDSAMPSRMRTFRCIYGRAKATMRMYDSALAEWGRDNQVGRGAALVDLMRAYPDMFEPIDFLWNRGLFQTLFLELWRLHEQQLRRLCKALFYNQWHVAAAEVNDFFDELESAPDYRSLFNCAFEQAWIHATGAAEDEHNTWRDLRNCIMSDSGTLELEHLEDGCVYLCRVISLLAAWGKNSHAVAYDGLAHLGSIGIPVCDSNSERLAEVSGQDDSQFLEAQWEKFISVLTHS